MHIKHVMLLYTENFFHSYSKVEMFRAHLNSMGVKRSFIENHNHDEGTKQVLTPKQVYAKPDPFFFLTQQSLSVFAA